jgi:SP family sugar:H+ symporter-like MFS transporter
MSEIKHKTGFVILITLVATIGGFLFGFDSGVINGTVDGLKTAFDSDNVVTGFNVASMLMGCALGALAAGRLADRFGRRTILLVASVCFFVSAWGSGISQDSVEFIIYRVLGGLAVGAASVLAPAYISEIAPAKVRGMLSSVQQVAIISGLFFAFLSNYFIAGKAGSSLHVFAWGYEAWRWMFWVELIPAVTFFFALLIIPESPRFLVASGKKDKAVSVLKKLMSGGEEEKAAEIQQSLKAGHRPRFRDLIDAKRGLRPIVWVGIGLAILQQITGINVIFYYGSVLWQAAGFAESHALLINVIGGAVSITACIASILTIDRLGRKPLLLIGSVGMALSLGIMAFIFAQAETGGNGQLLLPGLSGVAALVAANLFAFVFNFSWGPAMWVLLGEMFPNQIRGSAMGISGFMLWVTNFCITMTFPMMLTGIGLGGAYSIYAAFALISFFFVLKFTRETKGRELEAMEG